MLNKVQGRRSLFLLMVALFFATITGCATYGKATMMVGPHLSSRNYDEARAAIQKNIKDDGKDRLLYYMEIGLIDHLSGKYQASNSALSQAARIGEELETTRASDLLKVALTSPRSGAYRGTQFERAFIHYYKTLNYTFLAAENVSQRQKFMEDARIEARKVDIMLTALQNEEGNYKDVKDNEGKIFTKLMKLFDALQGRTLDKNWLVYREDAYIRYVTGLTYEANGEFDDARIAYQQAAELYEQGYAKQYSLGSEITEQAWFDVIRMMKRAGGYEGEWPTLSEKKLSESMRGRLKLFKPEMAQLVVITHTGMIPERREMNIHLTLDLPRKELVLRPILTGTRQEKNDQASWFFAMYSDRGLLGLISNYQTRGLYGSLDGLRSKRMGLGMSWGLAQSINLPQALAGLGARVTVPYYSPNPAVFTQADVWLDGQHQGRMIKAESIGQLALQEQLLGADKDLKMALARELSKSMTCELLGNLFAVQACKIVGMVTSQAETRNWLTLPDTISIKRIPVEAGVHRVRVLTRRADNRGVYHESEQEVEVKNGSITFLRERVLPRPAGGVATAVSTF